MRRRLWPAFSEEDTAEAETSTADGQIRCDRSGFHTWFL
jgi:hypothetical protein